MKLHRLLLHSEGALHAAPKGASVSDDGDASDRSNKPFPSSEAHPPIKRTDAMTSVDDIGDMIFMRMSYSSDKSSTRHSMCTSRQIESMPRLLGET